MAHQALASPTKALVAALAVSPVRRAVPRRLGVAASCCAASRPTATAGAGSGGGGGSSGDQCGGGTVQQLAQSQKSDPALAPPLSASRSAALPASPASLSSSAGGTAQRGRHAAAQPVSGGATGSGGAVTARTAATSAAAVAATAAPLVLDQPPALDAAGCPPPLLPLSPPDAPPRRAAMTGRRLAADYDVPLTPDWLSSAPDAPCERGGGRLELFLGPMYAGKTTALLRRMAELTACGAAAVAVKSAVDDRYGAHWLVSHNGACVRAFSAPSLASFRASLGKAWAKAAVVVVDEAQFFPDLAEFAASAVDEDGKTLLVAGLSGDFRRRNFGQLAELLPHADAVTTLTATCGFCGSDARFSLRLNGTHGPQALVGGEEMYRAACRRCYLKHSSTHDD